MKKIAKTLLIINSLYIIACADNPDVKVFIAPAVIYVLLILLSVYHQELNDFLTKEK